MEVHNILPDDIIIEIYRRNRILICTPTTAAMVTLVILIAMDSSAQDHIYIHDAMRTHRTQAQR